jgi:hypothetical protein
MNLKYIINLNYMRVTVIKCDDPIIRQQGFYVDMANYYNLAQAP